VFAFLVLFVWGPAFLVLFFALKLLINKIWLLFKKDLSFEDEEEVL
jgi:hypothetical protein